MSDDLMVVLGARLDQFSSDLSRAGDMADSAVSRIEQSFASLNPNFGGLGGLAASLGGATAAAGAFLAVIANINSELASVSKNAAYVGVSIEQLQRLQFAAGQGGVSNDQATTDLRNLANLLADAKQNENSLTKLLDANNIKYKDRAGDVIGVNDALKVAADLIGRMPSMPEKVKAAQMLGLSENWVQALSGGSKAFEAVANSADDAGAVIDRETVQRATQFDREWNRSTAHFSTVMKSALASLVPFFDDLIEKAEQFVATVNKQQIEQAANAQLDALRQPTGLPKDGGLVFDPNNAASQSYASQFRKDTFLSPSFFADAYHSVTNAFQYKSEAQLRDQVPGYAAGTVVEPSYPTQAQMDAAFEKQNGVPKPPPPANPAHLPERSQASDAYDHATESIAKLTAKTQAEADAQGLGAAALAETKAQYQLLTAAQQAGIPITQKVQDQMQDLAQDAGLAADALEKAKIASTLSRSQQTAFFTPEDLAIANQLKGLYGDNIPAAMRSSEAAALRFNDTIKELGTLGQQVNSGFLVDFETQIRNGASAMQALQTAGLSALGKIADKLASMAADNLWSAAFGGSSGGSILSLLGLGATHGVNAVGGTGLSLTATGGMYASGTDYAKGGLSLVGENGPELLNIPRGSQVIPNDVLRSGGMGGGVSAPVTISIDARNADAAGLARLQVQLDTLKSELPSRVVQAVTKAKKQRLLV